MTMKVMFVCLGNICRSPTAEGVFQKLAKEAGLDVVVDSSGTSGWHNGNQPDHRAMAEASARGYDLSPLRSSQIQTQDFHEFDLILCMDRDNLKNCKKIQPADAKAKLQLFLDYAPDQPLQDVPDPYYEHNFADVLSLIEQASHGLIASLKHA